VPIACGMVRRLVVEVLLGLLVIITHVVMVLGVLVPEDIQMVHVVVVAC